MFLPIRTLFTVMILMQTKQCFISKGNSKKEKEKKKKMILDRFIVPLLTVVCDVNQIEFGDLVGESSN